MNVLHLPEGKQCNSTANIQEITSLDKVDGQVWVMGFFERQ
jgi:hypothetical protein